MRIALISPYSIGPQRGNITSVNRISRNLGREGIELLVLPADVLSPAAMEQQILTFAPRLIHGFHAGYCGGLARHLAAQCNLPYIITVTGSDLHDPLVRNNTATIQAMEAARSIVCFDDGGAALLSQYLPAVADRITVIPQGVEMLPVTDADNFGVAEDAFVLLLPAALRPVKRVEFPLQTLAPLARSTPSIRLVIAGGIIDHEYAAGIRGMLATAPYAEWLGEVPRDQMGALYSRADIVLNCSSFESMPNTLLEAMALGRPVLAADIPGNRSIVRHGDTGFLYRDADTFVTGVTTLMTDSRLWAALGQRARTFIGDFFSPRHEATEYISLYRSLID